MSVFSPTKPTLIKTYYPGLMFGNPQGPSRAMGMHSPPRASVVNWIRSRKTSSAGSPAPSKKMLGDSVVATWLEVKYLEASMADGTGGSNPQAGVFLKRLESVQWRHLAAIKSLVQVRKLLSKSNSVPDVRIIPRESA